MNKNIKQLKSFFSDRKGEDRSSTLQTLFDQINLLNIGDELNMVMLWGAGDKSSATKADKDTLLYLLHFIHRIESLFNIKVQLKLIFTDTHIYLNGYDSNTARKYIADIIYHIKKHNFTYCFSSELCADYITSNGFSSYAELIDFTIKNSNSLFLTTGIDKASISNFYKYALKHCKRIGSHFSNIYFNNEEEAAKGYLYFASIEKDIISRSFPNHLFITYMSREEEFALPSLPIIRLYSLKSGLRTRPWFVN